MGYETLTSSIAKSLVKCAIAILRFYIDTVRFVDSDRPNITAT
ncbi:hypothetical protein [Chroococcidiopsis sp. SAG 2025]|nr:hypothetical protein [Chroococcidiopsis sp. SAG 2025]